MDRNGQATGRFNGTLMDRDHLQEMELSVATFSEPPDRIILQPALSSDTDTYSDSSVEEVDEGQDGCDDGRRDQGDSNWSTGTGTHTACLTP